MKLHCLEGVSREEFDNELANGARFVIYFYTISLIFVTFRRSSRVHFIRAHQSSAMQGLGYTLITLLLGWWGIPWGPIYSFQSLAANCSGGSDITRNIVATLKGIDYWN
jgi:hypothetical protein